VFLLLVLGWLGWQMGTARIIENYKAVVKISQ